MSLIYIAGPYRAQTVTGLQANINRARKIGELAAERGWYPVIPHNLSTGIEHVGDDTYWLDHTMAVMERCDAVLVCPNSDASTGTQGEIRRAGQMGLPIYYDAGELPALETL